MPHYISVFSLSPLTQCHLPLIATYYIIDHLLMERCQFLESHRCEHIVVCGQDHRIEPGDDGDEDEDGDSDVGVEPDVLGLVLLEPVVVAEEVGRVRHPQSIHIVLRLPPQI